MEQLIEISKTQIIMASVATCIESTARLPNVSYQDAYQRMKRVGMIENYIIPNYELLHSESREHLAAGMAECLRNWEENNQICILNQDIADKHLTYYGTELL